ncbi:MAG: GtrA family protein [Anaerolineae bacterium]|nr:GtrA family protein [Anaerolineae bacterium]
MTQSNTMSTSSSIRNPLDIPILAIASRFGDKSKEVERFLKFVVVGVIGFIVDFGTVTILQATVLPPTAKSGERIVENVIVATTIAFIAALLSNFTWNRIWTYPDSRSRSARRQLFLFTFISLVGWLARTLWITNAYHALGEIFMPILLPIIRIFRTAYVPSIAADDKLGTRVAMVVGVIVVTFWNFFANRHWTYNDVDSQS